MKVLLGGLLRCGPGCSAIASSILQSRGFKNVINFSGGYAESQAAGYPTESGVGTAAQSAAA